MQTGSSEIFNPVFWRQIYFLTVSNLKSRYRKTFAGFLWVVINPLVMFGVQSQVFGKFLKLQTPNYSLFLLSGLLPWIFITQSFEMSTSIFVSNGRLLKSFTIHPMVFLLSQLLDNLINFLAAFLLILIPFVVFHHDATSWGIFLVPLPIITLVLGVTGFSWLLATVQVFFRDTRFMISFFISIAFFLTPIFYPITFIPTHLRWIIAINPLYYFIEPFRMAIYEFSLPFFLISLLKSLLAAILCLTLAATFWTKKRNAVYFHV